MGRRLRYHVAVSLDGFMAGPNGEYDWIGTDPSIDFAAIYREFDTFVMGRKTYEVMRAQGGDGSVPGKEVVVFSRTLPSESRKGIRIVNDDPREVVTALKARPGRDIWLFGGGSLFRPLLDAGLVDTVEVAVIPVLLGAGVPLLPPGASTRLVLADQKKLPTSGIVALAWASSTTSTCESRTTSRHRRRPRRPRSSSSNARWSISWRRRRPSGGTRWRSKSKAEGTKAEGRRRQRPEARDGIDGRGTTDPRAVCCTRVNGFDGTADASVPRTQPGARRARGVPAVWIKT
jgi:dihydrofolate reductase